MSKQRKKTRPEKNKRRNVTSPMEGEDPRSVAVTVGWMMSTLATGSAVCLSAFAYLFVRSFRAEDAARSPLAALPGLLLFTALVTSVLTLALIPIVYRVRPTNPPPMVTVGSVCVAASPWIAMLVFVST